MEYPRVIDPAYKELIIQKAMDYCAREGILIGYLGSKIIRDGNFFKRLQNGGDCRAETLVKIDQWLNAQLNTVGE